MARAEVAVGDAVSEHVERGCQHARRDGDDRLLWTAPRADPVVLRAQIAVLLPDGGPRGLHERCFQPGCALPDPRVSLLARALVVPGTHTSPRDEMLCAREATHVGADLRD